MHVRHQRRPRKLPVEIGDYDWNDQRLRFDERREAENARLERERRPFGCAACSFGTYDQVLAVSQTARRSFEKGTAPLLREQLRVSFVLVHMFCVDVNISKPVEVFLVPVLVRMRFSDDSKGWLAILGT